MRRLAHRKLEKKQVFYEWCPPASSAPPAQPASQRRGCHGHEALMTVRFVRGRYRAVVMDKHGSFMQVSTHPGPGRDGATQALVPAHGSRCVMLTFFVRSPSRGRNSRGSSPSGARRCCAQRTSMRTSRLRTSRRWPRRGRPLPSRRAPPRPRPLPRKRGSRARAAPREYPANPPPAGSEGPSAPLPS